MRLILNCVFISIVVLFCFSCSSTQPKNTNLSLVTKLIIGNVFLGDKKLQSTDPITLGKLIQVKNNSSAQILLRTPKVVSEIHLEENSKFKFLQPTNKSIYLFPINGKKIKIIVKNANQNIYIKSSVMVAIVNKSCKIELDASQEQTELKVAEGEVRVRFALPKNLETLSQETLNNSGLETFIKKQFFQTIKQKSKIKLSKTEKESFYEPFKELFKSSEIINLSEQSSTHKLAKTKIEKWEKENQ